MNLRLSGDVRYSSSHYVTRIEDGYLTGQNAQYDALAYSRVDDKAVGNLNATLLLANGRYTITGYVRNVTNEKYKVWVPGIGTGVDSVGPTSGPNGVASSVVLNDPRTFGLILSAHF
jgi:outer membrane receptor protein involved in Fe transport